MNRFRMSALATGLSLILHAGASLAATLTVVTETSAITKASENDTEGGEATAFIMKVLEHAGIDYELQYMPWRRAYQRALRDPNVLLFPLARSTDREPHFNWLGELVPIHYYLFRKADRQDLSPESLAETRNNKIGVVNSHIHHELLSQQGFKRLEVVNNSEQNIRKLIYGRIDYFPMSDGGIFPLCQRTEIDCRQLQPVVELEGIAGGLYIALSHNSDPSISRRLLEAFQTLKDDGTHARYFAKRLDSLEKFNKRWPQ